MACQHFPDDQTLQLQTGAGEDDIIHLPSGLDRVDCKRQEEEEDFPHGALPGGVPSTSNLVLKWLLCQAPGVTESELRLVGPVSVYCGWVRQQV